MVGIPTRRKVKWTKSPARALLKKLLLDEKSYVHGKAAEDVYASHDWFQDYPAKKFKEYFADMAVAAKQHRSIVAEDNRLVNLEYTLIPINYEILRARFRHGRSTEDKMNLHKMATEMVAVIVQYDLHYRPLSEVDNYL
mmetsp:Transcript_11181/g.18454  ORF Transcript_11181/g.18454 Transcript_11181/m.18454 type:complete len:139 (-) Transcript_11181:34-450(-)